MSNTLTLDENLVKSLDCQAREQNMPWDQWAVDVLVRAVVPKTDKEWRVLNGRRLALIHEKYDKGISAAEEDELNFLQRVADKYLEPMDRPRMEWLEQMERRAKQIACSHE